jgi:serine/threonine protein kinase
MTQQSQTEPMSAALFRRMDEVCLRFEDDWQTGRRPDVQGFLATFPESGRGELLAELLLLEWDYRFQRGESVCLDEYVRNLAPWREAVEQAWQRWKERGQSGSTVLPATDAPAPSGMSDIAIPPLPAGYEKSEPIGKGGMGEVRKAFDPRLKRWVALKQVRLDQASSDRLARFRFEAEALAKLAHPHIVKVHGFTDTGGQPVLEMEYVAGGTLEEALRTREGLTPPMSPTEAARLVSILAWAVHSAHEKGIVHRDLKPANVLMDSPVAGSPDNVLGSFPKISDFGLAALADADTGQTLSGAILGTPAYMSPEQAAGKKHEIGPPADVWAVGVILYRCLTGALPFQGDSVLDTLERVKTMQMRSMREIRPDVPAELEAVCLACLSKDPDDRPTAAELAGRLERFLAGDRSAATSGSVSIKRTEAITKAPARRKRIAFSLRACGVAVSFSVTLSGLLLAMTWMVLHRAERDRVSTVETAASEDSPQSILQGEIKEKDVANEAPTVTLRVEHYGLDDGAYTPAGAIGERSFQAYCDDQVVIRVNLSRAAHCFLIGCNFDGKEQLLWPCDATKLGSPGLPDLPPRPVYRFTCPPPGPPGPDDKPAKPKRLALDDDMTGGMQAFVVVASRQPLPSYAEWRKRRGPIPWRKLPPSRGVWASSGETLDPLTPVVGRRRGQVVEVEGEPPLLALCRWARGKNTDAVEALTFPVFRREGK